MQQYLGTICLGFILVQIVVKCIKTWHFSTKLFITLILLKSIFHIISKGTYSIYYENIYS